MLPPLTRETCRRLKRCGLKCAGMKAAAGVLETSGARARRGNQCTQRTGIAVFRYVWIGKAAEMDHFPADRMYLPSCWNAGCRATRQNPVAELATFAYGIVAWPEATSDSHPGRRCQGTVFRTGVGSHRDQPIRRRRASPQARGLRFRCRFHLYVTA